MTTKQWQVTWLVVIVVCGYSVVGVLAYQNQGMWTFAVASVVTFGVVLLVTGKKFLK